jgi:hypothetical protein
MESLLVLLETVEFLHFLDLAQVCLSHSVMPKPSIILKDPPLPFVARDS